jgi:hypothetical protein
MLTTTQTPASNCLSCGSPNDAASHPKGKRPRPGNISVCLACGHIAAFDDNLKLRPLTDQEMIDVAGHPNLLRIQKLAFHVRHEKERQEKERLTTNKKIG